MRQKIVDCHMHTLSGAPEKLQTIADHFGFEKYAVLGCPCFAGPLNNLEVLLAKALHPGHVYAFGGLTYLPHERNGQTHVNQARQLMAAGFDGIKFIESKPTIARDLKLQMDSEEMAPVFALLEETQFPILWHVGDPAPFWDERTAPRFAVENGWCYTDSAFPTLKELYDQTERVLDRHPRLQVCLAHFYFTADDMPHARRMMDTYPGLRFDVTPGTEMYGHFLREPDLWREFFMQYQDRILFGTDLSDDEKDFESGLYDTLVGLIESALAQPGPVKVWDMQGRGLGLPGDVLDKLFAANTERMYGAAPRKICREGMAALIKGCEEHADAAQKQQLSRLADRLYSALEAGGMNDTCTLKNVKRMMI